MCTVLAMGASPSTRRGQLEQLREPAGADVVDLEVGCGWREARRHHVARHLDQDDPEAHGGEHLLPERVRHPPPAELLVAPDGLVARRQAGEAWHAIPL